MSVASRFAPAVRAHCALALIVSALCCVAPGAAARAQDPLAALDADDVPAERRAELARVLAQARVYLDESASDPARLELADRACANAARLDARSGEVQLVWAHVTIARGEVAGAIAHAERAATLAPRSFEAQLLYASLLLDVREARLAKVAYERALSLRATSYEARLGLALSLRRTGEPGAAAEQLRRCTRAAPRRPEAFYELGVTLSASTVDADASEGRAAYERFLALAGADPRYADAVRAARASQVPRHAPRRAPRSVTPRH